MEPRTISRPPTGALAIPSKNPKAPLPPRASQADAFEVSNVHPSVRGGRGISDVADIEELSPESLEPAATIRRVDALDDMRAAARKSNSSGGGPPPSRPGSRPGSPKPPSRPSTGGHEDAETAAVLPKDFSKALAQLEEQRRARGSNPPQSRTEVLQQPLVKSGSWESQRDALNQLQKQRDSGAPAPLPPPKSNPGNISRSAFDGPGPSTQKMEAPQRPTTSSLKNNSADVPSAKDLAKNLQRVAPAPVATPSAPAVDAPMPANAPSLLQSLIVTPSAGGAGGNAQNNAGGGGLNLKPGSGTPLAPVRSPSPMAIVGGSSLRINSPDKPMSPMGPLPRAGAGGNSPQRPATTPKGFAPAAGGPPQQYERAFRQWSSPAINEGGGGSGPDSNANAHSPLTSEAVSFQVYTPRDVAAGRGPMRTISPDAMPKKPSMGLRIGLGIVGGIVVLLTALAVIAVSTEDPKKPTPVPSAKPTVSLPATTTSMDDSPLPAPTAIVVGDPSDDSPTPSGTTAPTAKPARPKSTGAASTSTAAPPSSLKQIAPPPNPYGNK